MGLVAGGSSCARIMVESKVVGDTGVVCDQVYLLYANLKIEPKSCGHFQRYCARHSMATDVHDRHSTNSSDGFRRKNDGLKFCLSNQLLVLRDDINSISNPPGGFR